MASVRSLARWLGRATLPLTLAGSSAALGCSERVRLAEREPPQPSMPPPAGQPSTLGTGGATAPIASSSAAPASDTGKRRYVVAAMGDSLTDARSQGGKYLDLLRERCPQSRFDNYGVGGQMVNQMRHRFDRDVLGDPPTPDEPKPAYTDLIILGGINDICSDESAFRSNHKIEADLTIMYRAARTHGMRVLALTMPPWGGFKRYYTARRGASTREVNDWIRRQGAEHAVDGVLDVYPLLSCGQASVLCPRYAWSDQVHWNPEGHRIVGEALYQAFFADCE